MPIELKYGRVILENQRNIGDDEPVFIFRYRDALLPQVLEFYRSLCETSGSGDTHLAAIDADLDAIAAWQAKNGSRTPSSTGFNLKDMAPRLQQLSEETQGSS